MAMASAVSSCCKPRRARHYSHRVRLVMLRERWSGSPSKSGPCAIERNHLHVPANLIQKVRPVLHHLAPLW
jgi:hypothetical protein